MLLTDLAPRDRRWEDAIDALDPEAGAHQIFGIVFDHLFGPDLTLATELGQLRTFAVPSISRLLHATGEYGARGQRRVDDTRAILAEIIIPGPDSARGSAMIEHLGRIHAHYRIGNDDYLLTLAALAVSPVEHVDTFAFRPMRPVERDAWYRIWRRVGLRMGIKGVPEHQDGLRAFRNDYERRAVRYHPANEAVARALLAVVERLLPQPLRPLLEPTVSHLLCAPHVVAALGLRPPTAWQRAVIDRALAARRRIERRMTTLQRRRFSKTPAFLDLPSYPQGYERHLLGPRKLVARMVATAPGPAGG